MGQVELVQVSKFFKTARKQSFVAVDQINLTVSKGEFFSLLGSSGCGKTTTLRLIAGFEQPSQGEIYIDGQLMVDLPPFHRPVNTVFQNYALFPHLTVAQNIAFGLEMAKLPRQQIRLLVGEALAMVQLTGLEQRYPRQLSGGQQQRVALARAIVKRPQVLLLDEPLGALDLKLRQQMQLELKHLQQQLGITFIYVTHDQEEALTMSDRLGVMSGGKILQLGTPQELYEYPNCRFVADFLGETNLLTGEVVQKDGQQLTVLVDQQFPLVLPPQPHLNLHQQVTLGIRPEKVGIYPVEDTNHHSCRGTIEEIVYLGTDTKYIIGLTPTIRLSVRRQNDSPGKSYQGCPGELVQIQFPSEAVRVLLD